MDHIEAAVVHFRTAINGFNKKDVAQYVSQTATAHSDAMSKLSQQIRTLEQENETLRNVAPATDSAAELEVLLAEIAVLQEENGLLKNRVRQLEFKLEEASESVGTTAEEPAPAIPTDSASLQEKELEAYRRAEAMERRVTQRTHLINNQLHDIAAQTANQLTGALSSAKGVLGVIESQIAVLQKTAEGFGAAMTDGLSQIQSVSTLLPDNLDEN